jgi:large subunit ribosomal protein L6
LVKFGKNMSRIGQKSIIIPEGVSVKVTGQIVEVAGSGGELKLNFRPEIKVDINKGAVCVSRRQDNQLGRSLHGLTRTLIANMVKGVSEGYSKTLKLVGTGYRVKQEGDKLILSLGFSHPVVVEPIDKIEFEVKGNDTIKIKGIDKALVGQTAAQIRALRKPEPYKGKGIRYEGEEVKLKPGKAGKAGAAGLKGEE